MFRSMTEETNSPVATEGIRAVACRDLVMLGAIAWLDALLPKPNNEQWRMVVIVTGYTLFVILSHIQVCNQRFGEVCWHNMRI